MYDKNGQRFTNELQPRDLLSQAIFAQMEKDGTDFVWEDMRPLGEETIMKHFPNIFHRCVEEGFDPRKEPIPSFRHSTISWVESRLTLEAVLP